MTCTAVRMRGGRTAHALTLGHHGCDDGGVRHLVGLLDGVLQQLVGPGGADERLDGVVGSEDPLLGNLGLGLSPFQGTASLHSWQLPSQSSFGRIMSVIGVVDQPTALKATSPGISRPLFRVLHGSAGTGNFLSLLSWR